MKTLRIAFLILFGASALALAENWPQWRGPLDEGTSPETELPTTFSKTENVKWVADMPGESGATPVIWGDHVFVSSIDESREKIVAMCLDRKTGKQKWLVDIASGIGQDKRSNYASPSPSTDGKNAYFFYGTGDLVAIDFEGNVVWKKNIQKEHGKFAFLWTFSTTPLLDKGVLYLPVLQRDTAVNKKQKGNGKKLNDSYILALEAATGKEKWKVIRESKAVKESRESFASSIVHEVNGQQQLITAGGDCITGNALDDGRELWRWGTWNPERISHWRLVPTPAAGAGVVLVCAPKKAPIYALQLGGSGVLDDSAVVWKSDSKDISSDVSTPAFANGKFYILNSDRRTLSCVDPKGTVEWTVDTNSKTKIEGSPTVADGKVYMVSHRGDAFVCSATEPKVLHETRIGDAKDSMVRSTVAISQGNLFIRTGNKLYCIGD